MFDLDCLVGAAAPQLAGALQAWRMALPDCSHPLSRRTNLCIARHLVRIVQPVPLRLSAGLVHPGAGQPNRRLLAAAICTGAGGRVRGAGNCVFCLRWMRVADSCCWFNLQLPEELGKQLTSCISSAAACPFFAAVCCLLTTTLPCTMPCRCRWCGITSRAPPSSTARPSAQSCCRCAVHAVAPSPRSDQAALNAGHAWHAHECAVAFTLVEMPLTCAPII